MKVKAFRALLPTAEMASRVACKPYDTVTRDEAAEEARRDPWSFMHVVRPDADLPPDVPPHDERAYAMARAAMARFLSEGVLRMDDAARVFVYRQRMGAHEQTGIVVCCHADDYRGGVIRRHERTRPDKEADRTRHILAVRAHTGLVFLAYRGRPAIDALVAAARGETPWVDVTMPDGVAHTIWRLTRPEGLLAALGDLPEAYIADGHHRAAASVLAAGQLADEGSAASGEAAWFPAVLFPAGQLRVLAYNRLIKDLNGRTPGALLEAVRRRFDVREAASAAPDRPGRVAMYLDGRWFGVAWRGDCAGTDPAAKLDVARLQGELLGPLLGIADPRTDPRIEFVGGSTPAEALARMVDAGKAAAAFSMCPASVESMMAVADAGGVMPPKSTWFEPKLRSGFLVHPF